MRALRRKRPEASERPAQETPAEIIEDLMQFVRTSFYQGNPAWYKDQHFIRQRVVTYPASWLNSRAVTLKPERYKEVMINIVRIIKLNGNTGSVQYWPRYLLHCVQEHLKHHGEELYNEGKSIRAQTDIALVACQRATQANRAPDVVAAIAQVNQALASATRRKKVVAPAKQQLSLF